MGVASDILRAYVAPREVFRTRLGPEPREDRALAILIVACLIIFVAQMPSAQRGAFFAPDVPFEARATAALFRSLFIAPIAFYALAALSGLAARLFGRKSSGYAMRFALFWALLVASPLWLLWGLVEGFIGPGIQSSLIGSVALLGFVVHWALNLSVATRE
jgi:hypothetical protein